METLINKVFNSKTTKKTRKSRNASFRCFGIYDARLNPLFNIPRKSIKGSKLLLFVLFS